jgi:crossover junction endodeoxyribonuclease RusA
MIELNAPLPPTINHYYKLAKGRKYITADGQSYRETVCWYLRQKGCHPDAPRYVSDRLKVHIKLYQSDKRHWDIDNRCKSLLDALQHGGAYKNDSQIDVLLVERLPADVSSCTVLIDVCDNGQNLTGVNHESDLEKQNDTSERATSNTSSGGT